MVAETEDEEDIVFAFIGMYRVQVVDCVLKTFPSDPEIFVEARSGIPVTTQRRFDVYPDVSAHAA